MIMVAENKKIQMVTIKSSGVRLCQYDESLDDDDDDQDRFQHLLAREYTVLTARSLKQQQPKPLEQIECLTQHSTTSLLSPPTSNDSSESFHSDAEDGTTTTTTCGDGGPEESDNVTSNSNKDKYKFCVCGNGYVYKNERATMCSDCSHWFHRSCVQQASSNQQDTTDGGGSLVVRCFVCSKNKELIKKYEHAIKIRKVIIQEEEEEEDDDNNEETSDNNSDSEESSESTASSSSSDGSSSESERENGIKFTSSKRVSRQFKNITKASSLRGRRRIKLIAPTSSSSSSSTVVSTTTTASTLSSKSTESITSTSSDGRRGGGRRGKSINNNESTQSNTMDAKLERVKQSIKLKNQAKQTMMLPEKSLSGLRRNLKKVKTPPVNITAPSAAAAAVLPQSPLVDKTRSTSNSIEKYLSVGNTCTNLNNSTSSSSHHPEYNRTGSLSDKDKAIQLVFEKLSTRVHIEISENTPSGAELQNKPEVSEASLRHLSEQLVERVYQKLEHDKGDKRLYLIRSALNNKNNTTFWYHLVIGGIDLDELATMPSDQITKDDRVREREQQDRDREMERLQAANNEARREWGKFLKQTNQSNRIDPKDLEELKNTPPPPASTSNKLTETTTATTTTSDSGEVALNKSDLPPSTNHIVNSDESPPSLVKSSSVESQPAITPTNISSLSAAAVAAAAVVISDADIEINLDKLPPKRSISLAEYAQKNPPNLSSSISGTLTSTTTTMTTTLTTSTISTMSLSLSTPCLQSMQYQMMVKTIDDEFFDREIYMKFSLVTSLHEVASMDQELVDVVIKKLLEPCTSEHTLSGQMLEARLNRANDLKHLWNDVVVQRVQENNKRCVYLLFEPPADDSTSRLSRYATSQGVTHAYDRDMYAWMFRMVQKSADKERKFWYYRVTEDTPTHEGVRLFFVHLRKVDDDPEKKEKSMIKYQLRLKRDRDYILGVVVPRLKKQSKVVMMTNNTKTDAKSVTTTTNSATCNITTKRKQDDREYTDEETDCQAKKDKKPRIVAEGGGATPPTNSSTTQPQQVCRDPRIKAAENKRVLSSVSINNQTTSLPSSPVVKSVVNNKPSTTTTTLGETNSSENAQKTQPASVSVSPTPPTVSPAQPVVSLSSSCEAKTPPKESSSQVKTVEPQQVAKSATTSPTETMKNQISTKSLLIPSSSSCPSPSKRARTDKTVDDNVAIQKSIEHNLNLLRDATIKKQQQHSKENNTTMMDTTLDESMTTTTTSNGGDNYSADFYKIDKLLNEFDHVKFEEGLSTFHNLIEKEKIMPQKLTTREYRVIIEKHKFMTNYVNSLFANRPVVSSNESAVITTPSAATTTTPAVVSPKASNTSSSYKQSSSSTDKDKFQLPEDVRSVWKGDSVEAFAHQRRLLTLAASDMHMAAKMSLTSDVYDLDEEFFSTASNMVTTQLKRLSESINN